MAEEEGKDSYTSHTQRLWVSKNAKSQLTLFSFCFQLASTFFPLNAVVKDEEKLEEERLQLAPRVSQPFQKTFCFIFKSLFLFLLFIVCCFRFYFCSVYACFMTTWSFSFMDSLTDKALMLRYINSWYCAGRKTVATGYQTYEWAVGLLRIQDALIFAMC